MANDEPVAKSAFSRSPPLPIRVPDLCTFWTAILHSRVHAVGMKGATATAPEWWVRDMVLVTQAQ